jgi:parvulin-like peptidyl-prolyl isomerase
VEALNGDPKAEIQGPWAKRLYIGGVMVGLAMAAFAALGPLKTGPLPTGAVARVGPVLISRQTYDSAIEGLTADKRNPLTSADKAMALSRLIDEELLVQRGQELGLVTSEGSVRKALVDAMIQFAAAEAAGREPTDSELRAYYDQRPARFARAGRVSLRAATLPANTETKIEAARQALRQGLGFDAAMSAVEADQIMIPDGLMPVAKVADYAGPTVRDAAAKLEPGQVAGPLKADDHVVFVYLLDRQLGVRPDFDAVRDTVAEEWRRDNQSKALDTYLLDLRKTAKITLAADAPKAAAP